MSLKLKLNQIGIQKHKLLSLKKTSETTILNHRHVFLTET